MGSFYKWVDIARKLAQRSPHPKYKMAALVLKSGRILARATNRQPHCAHAEAVALRGYEDGRFEGATIVVTRLLVKGVGMARPCALCSDVIRRAKLRRVIYTGWDGTLYAEGV